MSVNRCGNKVEGKKSFFQCKSNDCGSGSCKCNRRSKCEKPCEKPCEQPCKKDYCSEEAKISVEKNVVNISYLDDFGNTSGPDFIAIYELVLFNRSNCILKNLSVIDSFLGLDPEPLSNGGGELRPYFTNVSAVGYEPNIFPLTYDQIGTLNTGEILDTTQSFLPAKSITRILIRIAGRGFFIPTNPNTGSPVENPGFRSKLAYILQNTALIKGSFVETDHCGNIVCDYPIFPIYVKSGVSQIGINQTAYEAPIQG